MRANVRRNPHRTTSAGTAGATPSRGSPLIGCTGASLAPSPFHTVGTVVLHRAEDCVDRGHRREPYTLIVPHRWAPQVPHRVENLFRPGRSTSRCASKAANTGPQPRVIHQACVPCPEAPCLPPSLCCQAEWPLCAALNTMRRSLSSC